MTVQPFAGRPGSQNFVELVAANVRAACGRRRVRQADLVRLTSLSRSSLSRKWSGRDPFDVGELVEIAEVLEMPVPELLGSTGQKTLDSHALAA